MYTPQHSQPPWINDSSHIPTLQHNPTAPFPLSSKLDRKRQAQQWIEKILGYNLPTNDLQYDLQDGVLLCQVLNKVCPGSVLNIGYKDHPYVKMENITNFLSGLRQASYCASHGLGLKNSDLFQPNDLFDGEDIMPIVNTVLILERTISTNGLPPMSRKRLSSVTASTFSKSTPFEVYEDLTHPAPNLSLSSELKLRSSLNHIPMAALSLNDFGYPDNQDANIPPKYSRSKHHSELSYMTDMSAQAMRRKKSRSEIISEHSSREQRYDKQDRPQYRHVKDILFDMQGQTKPYTGRRNSSVHVAPQEPLNFPSRLFQKANALTEASSQVFPSPNKDDMQPPIQDDHYPNSIRSPADSGYGTNDRRRLAKQPSIPASFMSSSTDSNNTITAHNTQKHDNFNSTRSQNHSREHGSSSSKHNILDNLHFPKKSSTRQKIPFHARYQEWSDQKKDKLVSSRIPQMNTLSQSDAALDLAGADTHCSYEDDVDEFGNLYSPNPFPSISSPIPTLKDPNEKSNIFKSGSVGKQKDNRLSNPFHTKSPESRRTMDISKDKLCLFDDTGDLIAQYQLGNCIGKGQYGSVYKALNLGTGQMVAVKRIALESANSREIDEIMKEVELLKSLSHPNVVQYEGFSFSENHLNIILEYVENGSLRNTLQAFGAFPERLVASYCVRILQGLSYLHRNQVVHCDLKAANILTTKGGNVKLTDFGVSLNLKMKNVEDGVVAGTPNWMAPEIIELKGACFQSDIWSLGCTIVELCTGKPPYSDLISMATLFRIVEDDCPPLPENITKDLKDFLRKCFQKIPSNRPSPEELMDHAWIRNNVSQSPLDAVVETQHHHRHHALKRHTTAPDVLLMQQGHFANDDPLDKTNSLSYRQPNYSDGNLPALAAGDRPTLGDKPLPSIPTQQASPANDHQGPAARSVGYLMSRGAGGVTSRLFSRASKRFSREIEYSDLHRFVKTSFAKAVVCKACLQLIKKHALFCEDCSLICHEKCKQSTPPCSIYIASRPSLDEPPAQGDSPPAADRDVDVPVVNARPRPYSEPPHPTRRRKSAITIPEELMESQANTPIRSFPSSNSPLPTSSISANLRERTRKLSKAFSSVSTTSLNLADFGRMGRSRDNLQNVENDLRSSHLSSFRGYSDDIRPSSSSIISQDGVSGAKRRKSEKEDCVIS